MRKMFALILTIMVLFCCAIPTFAEDVPNQGVEGDVIQVLEPEIVEVQLGKEFANQGFKLKLDYGEYPNTIYADEKGVLRLELGGSSEYIITRVNETKPDEPDATGYSGIIADTTSQSGVSQTEPADKDGGTKFPVGVIIMAVALLGLGLVSYFLTNKPTNKKIKAPKKFDAKQKTDVDKQ